MRRDNSSQERVNARHPVVPPFVLWAIAIAFWWGAFICRSPSESGWNDVGSAMVLASLACGWIGGWFTLRALNAGDVRCDRRRLDVQSRATAQAHGQARFANRKDVKAFGLTKGPGVFLGRYREGLIYKRDLHYTGENHVLTIGPAGSGKGTCVVTNNLILNPESMVVLDLKLELYAMTARYRREVLGHDVVLLSPFYESLNAELGLNTMDDGYDPCVLVRAGSSTVKDDAELLASLLLPLPAQADAKSEFFNDAGQQILTAAILMVICMGERLTLPRLRAWLMAPPEVLQEQLIGMTQATAFNGLLREMGSRLLGTLLNAPQEFQGGLSSALKALRLYDGFGPMGRHVSRGDGFSFGNMKKRPTTVYIALPSERGITHAAWMNLVLSSGIEMIGRDRSNKRVTFLLDEMMNVGYLPNLLRAMAQYRAQGLRVHGFIQQVSQVRRLYGAEGWRDMVGLCDVVQAFGVHELETCKLLSEMTGQTTVQDVSASMSPAMIEAMSYGHLSYSERRSGAPLMRPEDIRAMPSSKQLIFFRNMPPLLADKVDYRSRRAWKNRVDPNPYYERR